MKNSVKKIQFIKMHGLGNDYIYVDCFDPQTAALISKTNLPSLAQQLSDRHFGIGSDGLVLILPSAEADAQMRIFNADGSEAQMCGNAIRCVGKYLYESALCRRPRLFIETLAGIKTLTLQVQDGIVSQVSVNMGSPKVTTDSLALQGNDLLGFTSVNMGNPHAVFFRAQHLLDAEIAKMGHLISTHPHFPEGTNVEFVHVRNPHELEVRVFERGSGPTLACGTGACAAAVAAYKYGETEAEMTVHLPGGDLLVHYDHRTNTVTLTGSATEVFRGEYSL